MKGNSVFSFVDVFCCLCIVFLVITNEGLQEDTAENIEAKYPRVHIFVEKTEKDYKIKCNGRYIEMYELSKIINMARNEVNTIQVIADFDGEVFYKDYARVEAEVLACGKAKKDEKQLTVIFVDNLQL